MVKGSIEALSMRLLKRSSVSENMRLDVSNVKLSVESVDAPT